MSYEESPAFVFLILNLSVFQTKLYNYTKQKIGSGNDVAPVLEFTGRLRKLSL